MHNQVRMRMRNRVTNRQEPSDTLAKRQALLIERSVNSLARNILEHQVKLPVAHRARV